MGGEKQVMLHRQKEEATLHEGGGGERNRSCYIGRKKEATLHRW